MYVADRQTGTFIEEIATIDEGLKLIRQYEEADKAEGTYEEDFYSIVDEDHCTVTEETTMKKFYLIEVVNGDMYDTILPDEKTEAIKAARAIYNALSSYDKKRRSEAYVVYADAEDGIVDLDTSEFVTDLLTEKQISLDNGIHFMTAEEAMPEIEEKGLWDVVAEYMEDDAREEANREIAPCTELEFLKKYLEIATEDLVIG